MSDNDDGVDCGSCGDDASCYDSYGDDGDYGSYEGDDGHCYDDGSHGSYDDEAVHYDDRDSGEDYEACDEECEDTYASSQEPEDSDASRYDDPTYSSCEEFEHDSDIDRVDDDVEYMNCSYASSLGVANGVQGSSRGPSISMGGGGGCSVGKKKLAPSRYAKRPNASNSHVEGGMTDGVAFATKGLCAVRGVDGCSRSSTMGYGSKARGTYGFHGEVPSLTSNNIANVGRVTGSGGCSSGVAASGGIRKTQVVGVDTCGHSSSHLDANLQNLGRCRFVVGVNGIDGYLLKIGDTDANCISTSLVDRLRIPCHKLAHPYEYDGVWVSKEARVLISHGSYRCYVWCDVYPMRHVDMWMGEPWLEGKRVQYSVVKGAYLVGVGQRVYDFVPYRAKSQVPTSAPSLARQRSNEQELHSMVGKVEQSRSPTITRSGGTSAMKELANVNKVSPKPLPKPSGSPMKKKETSSDESPSPRFRVDVKSPPTPAMGILGPRPNSPEFERQKIERSKGATGDNSRVEKGEVVLSDVSELSPPESTPDLGKKMREKKEGKRKIESEGTPYSNLNPLSFSSMCLNSCVGILGGKPMEPQPCSEIERQGEGDAECELQGEDVLDTSKVWNHDFFWESMQPGGGDMPKLGLLQQIEKDFGSFTNFREKFIQAALTLFGSGWIWLVLKREEKRLAIVKTSNAVNPLLWNDIPLIGLDLWEHAYYLDYKNDKAKYVNVYMDHLVSWDAALGRMARAQAFVNLGEPKIPVA